MNPLTSLVCVQRAHSAVWRLDSLICLLSTHLHTSHSSGANESAACCLQEKKEVKVGIEFLNAEEARQAIVESMRRYAGQLCCHLIPQVYDR